MLLPDRPAPDARARREAAFRTERRPAPRGKVRLSDAAKARLLDTGDLSRFELDNDRRHARSERPPRRGNHHADVLRRREDPRDARRHGPKKNDRAPRKRH